MPEVVLLISSGTWFLVTLLVAVIVIVISSLSAIGVITNTMWQVRRIQAGKQTDFSWRWIRLWVLGALTISIVIWLIVQ